MKTKLILLLLLCACYSRTQAQQQIKLPTWDSLNGGNGVDCFTTIKQAVDSTIIIGGYSNSVEYNHHGSNDGWLMKRNVDGSVAWQWHYGTNNVEIFTSFIILPDGNIIASGAISPFIGVLPVGFHGMTDVFVVKISGYDGHVIWQKYPGGSGDDVCYNVIFDSLTNSCIFVGKTTSNDGDFTNFSVGYGGYDAFVMKTDTAGNILGLSKFGGSNFDCFESLAQNQNGHIVAVGESESIDFDASTNHIGNTGQQSDVFVVTLDINLVPLWIKCIGSSGGEIGSDVVCLSDNSIVIGGKALSHDGVNGDIFYSSLGPLDGTIFCLSESGTVIWSHYYGGATNEYEIKLKVNPYTGDLFAFGVIDSDIPAVMGGDNNTWIFIINPVSGLPIDTVFIDGPEHESIFDLLPLLDNHFIAVGQKCPTTFTPTWNGFTIGTSEGFQPRVVNVLTHVEGIGMRGSVLYPNPAGDDLNIVNNTYISTVKIFGLDGTLVFFEKSEFLNQTKKTIKINGIPKGLYIVNINNTVNVRLVKN